jgi:hypothetical protein
VRIAHRIGIDRIPREVDGTLDSEALRVFEEELAR